MMSGDSSLSPIEKPAFTGEVILGSLPFALFGLVLIFFELPHEWNLPARLNAVGGFLFVLTLILPAVGFGAGWVLNFPRWTYLYAGMALVMALYIQQVSTPGLQLFGYPIFGREGWGWRAWVPLGLALLAALMISRSFNPIARFFSNLWNDWTIPSFLMAGFLPLIILIAFDEMDRLYSLYFMAGFAVLLVGTAAFYLLARSTLQRVLALTVGILAILAATSLGTASYWLAHNGTSPSGARQTMMLAGIIALVMLLPAWLELLRRSARRLLSLG
jgi:hypothetical protein